MANRLKEDEKNERIIRGLLKLAQNRRCINCNSLGPQYVCTNFWTFVCTTCSGIHREFTHRVKSVSMAKFTSQEVAALQEGGNQRARDIYFKEWDSQRQSSPDSSNVERLRDFIRHVYVDRRYTGDRNSGKPPSMKTDNKEEFYENRRNDAYRGSRSPPYEDTYEHRYNERSSPGGRSDDKYSRYSYDERRSPGYDQESRQYNNNTRSPARPEIINDWRREDRFGNGRKVEDRRISDEDSKLEGRSPERPKEDNSSPPMVRPVREILGDNVVPLRISEPPKANVLRAADVTAQAQRTASSSSLGSVNGNPVEVKLENTGSLIDFDADPEPPASASIPQAQQTTTPQSIAQPASATNDNNWASFDFAPDNKASQAPPNANPLESVLSQLSVPVPGPGHLLAPSGAGAPATAAVGNATSASLFSPAGNTSMLPFNSVAPAATPVSNLPTLHPGGVSAAAPGLAPAMPVNGGNSFVNFTQAGQWPNVQHQQPSLFPVSTGHSTSPQFTRPLNVASGYQTWNVSPASNVQVSLATPYAGAQIVSKPASGVTSTGLSQPPALEVKPTGRRELPEDLFAATFSSYPVASPGWQTGPARGMGFAVQYNSVPAPMPTYHQPSKSANPFDLSEPVQAQHFPSMTSLHAALPNMPPSQGIQRTSSLGTPSPAWMSSQSSHPPTFPSQAPSYSSSIPPRAFVAQQAPSSMPFVGHQVGVGFGSDGAAFGSVNMDQQVAGRFSGPPNPQPFSSVGGNPFG